MDKDLTVKENALEILESSASKLDWKNACDAIKKANGGNYPSWWYQEVIANRLVHQVSAIWQRRRYTHLD